MKSTPIRALAALTLATPLLAQAGEPERIEMPGQVFVCFKTGSAQFDLTQKTRDWQLQAGATPIRIESSRSVLQWNRRGEEATTNVVLLDFTPTTVSPLEVERQLEAMGDVEWAHPNVGFRGEFRELVPNDPQYASQWHPPVMQNDDAWDITMGDSSIIVAVCDDGVDVDHEDLVANMWTNTGETPGDGIDNDNNGYIDDVDGWDFANHNNDPNPNGTFDDHGTHVAGISSADTDNGIGVSGTAGDSTIMACQFYYPSIPWLASDIAEAFSYAADNGAKILNTSYNMDTWVGDPVVLAAFEYLYDNDVLHFNSAGNGGALNPPRADYFQTTFFVVNTDSGDNRSSSSNYGAGVDLSAPGSSILSTEIGDTYGTKSGTSMAAPNACGVAALVWGQNPGWTRDQVAAQVIGTCDNIDAQNPGFEGLLGTGRVNSFRALTEDLPDPQIGMAVGLPAEGATIGGGILDGISLRFDQIMDPDSVNTPGAFSLIYAGGDDTFGTGDDATVPVSLDDEYLLSSTGAALSVGGSLPGVGFYRFVADASILSNPFGDPLDGDGDGTGGDHWVRNFSSCAATIIEEDNGEDSTGYSVVNENLSTGAWTVPSLVPSQGGVRNDPPTDNDGSGKCYVTGDGSSEDVDGGPTRLITRAFDLSGISQPFMSVARWHLTNGDDLLETHISNDDGNSWTHVDTVASLDGWETVTIPVSDYVTPTNQVRLRFSVADNPNAFITESGIDTIRVVSIDCGDLFEVGTNFCTSTANSAGPGCTIRAEGSAIVANNDFELIAEGALPNVTGLFFMGPNQIQIPFGDGFQCVGGGLTRLAPVAIANGSGIANRQLDLTAPPVAGLISPGITTNFQYWFRDVPAGGAGFNTSDGLSVTWQ